MMFVYALALPIVVLLLLPVLAPGLVLRLAKSSLRPEMLDISGGGVRDLRLAETAFVILICDQGRAHRFRGVDTRMENKGFGAGLEGFGIRFIGHAKRKYLDRALFNEDL